MGDFTSEKEQKLLESEAEVSTQKIQMQTNSLLKKYLDFQMMMTTVMKKRNRKRNSLDMTSKTRSSLSVSLR
mgnify:CR=1 FL=1